MLENQKELNTEFLKAVKLGSMDNIISALQKGADLNSKTVKGNNALFIAANTNNMDLFIALLDATQKDIPINLDNQNSDGNTVLFECVKMPKGEPFVKLLLERNANPNIINKVDVTPLIQVCGDKNLEMIKLLTDYSKTDINYVAPFTKTSAYLMAASQGYMEGLEILVNKGADTKVLDGQGRTALMVALAASISGKSSEKKAQRQLINYLIDVEQDLSYKVPTGMTAFWLASYKRYTEEAMKMLFKGVEVDVTHEIGFDGKTTPLHLWAKNGNPILVGMILTKGGRLGVVDGSGNTPEAYGFINPFLQQIMLDYNADVNTFYTFKDKEGFDCKVPALSLVIKSGQNFSPIIEEMISRGAKIQYEDSKMDAFQPVIISISKDAFEITNFLIDKNEIDLNRHYEIVQGAEKQSLLQIIVSDYKNETSIELNETKLQLESIISKAKNDKKEEIDSDIEEEDIQSLEDLLKILNEITEKKLDLLNKLIKNGARIENANELGNTEIFMVRNPLFADFLLESGANIHHRNNNEQNVLYHSVLNNNNLNMIQYWKKIFEKNNEPIIKDIFYQIAFEDFSINKYKYKNVRKGLISYLNQSEVNDLFNTSIKDKPVVHIPELYYQDEDGNSPLLVACANNSLNLVKLYLKLNAPINLENNAGETPLIHALNTKNIQLVDTLIKSGADLHVKFNGNSILEIAQMLNETYIVNIIEKALENPEPKNVIVEEEDEATTIVPPIKAVSIKI